MKDDQTRVKNLIIETISVLCRNGLKCKRSMSIQGLIGITLDEDDVFIIHVDDTLIINDPITNTTQSNRQPDNIEITPRLNKNENSNKRNKICSLDSIDDENDQVMETTCMNDIEQTTKTKYTAIDYDDNDDVNDDDANNGANRVGAINLSNLKCENSKSNQPTESESQKHIEVRNTNKSILEKRRLNVCMSKNKSDVIFIKSETYDDDSDVVDVSTDSHKNIIINSDDFNSDNNNNNNDTNNYNNNNDVNNYNINDDNNFNDVNHYNGNYDNVVGFKFTDHGHSLTSHHFDDEEEDDDGDNDCIDDDNDLIINNNNNRLKNTLKNHDAAADNCNINNRAKYLSDHEYEDFDSKSSRNFESLIGQSMSNGLLPLSVHSTQLLSSLHTRYSNNNSLNNSSNISHRYTSVHQYKTPQISSPSSATTTTNNSLTSQLCSNLSSRFACEFQDCGITFSNKQNLLRHQTNKHGRPKLARRSNRSINDLLFNFRTQRT